MHRLRASPRWSTGFAHEARLPESAPERRGRPVQARADVTGRGPFRWISISQAASSASNVVVVVAAAASTSTDAVGRVTLLGAVYLMALCVCRGLVCDPLLLTDDPAPEDASNAVAVAGFIGPATALLLAPVVGPLLGPDASSLAWLAPALCPLLMQDALRYLAFRRGQALRAAVSDVVWLVVAAGLCYVQWRQGAAAPAALFGGWCAGGACAWLLLGAWLGVWPRVTRPIALLRKDARLRVSLLSDGLLTVGAIQAALVLTAVVAGNAAAGVVRFLQALFGPVTILFGALYISHTRSAGTGDGKGVARSLAIALTVATAAFATAFWALPSGIAHAIGGETMAAARAVLWPFTFAQVASALGTAAMSGLRISARAEAAAKVRAVWAVALLGATLVGGTLGGTLGVVYATATTHAAGAALWWSVLRQTRPDAARGQ